MAQVSFEFSMFPHRKASGKAKGGDKGNRLLCHGHTLFCLLSTYHWGTKSPSLHAILMGLSIRHWSKDWVCDLSKANQWTSPESDIWMLKESSNISTRTAKRICEPRILMAMFSNSWKNLSTKAVKEANPQREGEGRDEGQRQTWWHHLAPGTNWDKARKTSGLHSYVGQYIPFFPRACLSGVIWNHKNADLWH